ncbi:MAG: hypothetical protein CL424_00480 [Acidimicrobiaceae bacterium]|uniref:mercury resistance system transport protein MerF n=1 Tax=Indioceanicola profundi TaxID=2220096 RepID=UPI000C95328A|nr:mercury resistance system transport protein MerF [Indioceanicola profundi]MAT03515.1 hypothetical protein [Acidimicrobiaceae bacterium]
MTAPERTKAARLRRNGLIGAAIAAICCFTPFLVIVTAGVGLSALVGGLDYVLFPLLFGSLGIVAYALWIEHGRAGPSPRVVIAAAVIVATVALYWLEFRYALRLSVAAAVAVVAYWVWLRRSAVRTSTEI